VILFEWHLGGYLCTSLGQNLYPSSYDRALVSVLDGPFCFSLVLVTLNKHSLRQVHSHQWWLVMVMVTHHLFMGVHFQLSSMDTAHLAMTISSTPTWTIFVWFLGFTAHSLRHKCSPSIYECARISSPFYGWLTIPSEDPWHVTYWVFVWLTDSKSPYKLKCPLRTGSLQTKCPLRTGSLQTKVSIKDGFPYKLKRPIGLVFIIS